MKRSSKNILLSSFFLTLSSISFAAEKLPIYPSLLTGKKSYELGQLILLMIPDKGQKIGWDWQANNPNIIWFDNPFHEEDNSEYYDNNMKYTRKGILRINNLGKPATVLKNRNVELGWSIIYSSGNFPKFGLDRISLFPSGDSNLEMFYESPCFNVLSKNCDIEPMQSLKNLGVSIKMVCNADGISETKRIYQLSSINKKTIYLYEYSTGGSGGTFNQYISLLLNNTQKEACDIIK